MDHFENIVGTLLEAEGHWVRRSYKVNLTTEEKRRIGKPSIPRPEIDLLAFKVDRNEITVWEAKSFLDSPGVDPHDLTEEHPEPQGRYKLFTCEPYRTIVLERLRQQLVAEGMATAQTTARRGLAAGNVRAGQREALRQFMQERDWLFWSPEDIKQKVTNLARRGYENDAAIITAKILMR